MESHPSASSFTMQVTMPVVVVQGVGRRRGWVRVGVGWDGVEGWVNGGSGIVSFRFQLHLRVTRPMALVQCVGRRRGWVLVGVGWS